MITYTSDALPICLKYRARARKNTDRITDPIPSYPHTLLFLSHPHLRLTPDSTARLRPPHPPPQNLHYACAYRDLVKALTVLTKSAVYYTTSPNNKGCTPLHFALGNADLPTSPAVIQLLLSQDRNTVNAETTEGSQLPLHLLSTRAILLLDKNVYRSRQRENV